MGRAALGFAAGLTVASVLLLVRTAAAEGDCVDLGNHCWRTPQDADGNYGNNEMCNISLPEGGAILIHVYRFNTEAGFDFLTVDGTRFSGSNDPQNVPVVKSLTWRTDGGVVRSGWHICLRSAPELWTTVSSSTACQGGSCASHASAYAMTSPGPLASGQGLWDCQLACESAPGCAAINYFHDMRWCDLLSGGGCQPLSDCALGYGASYHELTVPTWYPTWYPTWHPTWYPSAYPAAPTGYPTSAEVDHCIYLGNHCWRTRYETVGRLYGNNDHCDIPLPGGGPARIIVHRFDTETNYDSLTVDGTKYSGRRGPDRVIVHSSLQWNSNLRVPWRGWHICLETPTGTVTVTTCTGNPASSCLSRDSCSDRLYVSINGGPDAAAGMWDLGGSLGMSYSFEVPAPIGPVRTVRLTRVVSERWADDWQMCGMTVQTDSGTWIWKQGTGVWFYARCNASGDYRMNPVFGYGFDTEYYGNSSTSYNYSFTWSWAPGNVDEPTISPVINCSDPQVGITHDRFSAARVVAPLTGQQGSKATLTNCRHADPMFRVPGRTNLQSTPCPEETWGVFATPRWRVFACDNGGSGRHAAWRCLWDSETLNGVPCESLGLLGCPIHIHGVAFTSDFRVLYAACEFQVSRCAWDDSTGTASDCALIGNACGSNIWQGDVLLSDDRTLLVLCAPPANRMMKCDLGSPGGNVLSSCTPFGGNLCGSATLAWGLAAESDTDVLVVCDEEAKRCSFTASGFATCVTIGPSPCPSGGGSRFSAVTLLTGETGVSCDNGGYMVCDITEGRPTSFPTHTAYPSSVYPTSPTGWPSTGFPTRPPAVPTGFPSTGFPSRSPREPTGFPTRTGFPSRSPSGYPSGFPSRPPTGFPTRTGYPSRQPTGFPSRGTLSPVPGPVLFSSCTVRAGGYTVDGVQRDSPCHLGSWDRHVDYVGAYGDSARLYTCSAEGAHHFVLCTCSGAACAPSEEPRTCFVAQNNGLGCGGTLRGAVFSSDGTEAFLACNKEVRVCRVDLGSRNGNWYSDCQVLQHAGCPRWAGIRGIAARPRGPTRGDLLVVVCTDWKTRACSLDSGNMQMQPGRVCVNGQERLCDGIGKPSGLSFNTDSRLLVPCGGGYSYSRFVGGIVRYITHNVYSGDRPCPVETNAVADLGSGRAAVACGPDGVRDCQIQYS